VANAAGFLITERDSELRVIARDAGTHRRFLFCRKSRKSKLAIAQFDILCYAFRSAVYADMTLPPGSMSAFVYGDVCQNG